MVAFFFIHPVEQNDEEIRDPLQMAEIFNNHFTNLAKDLVEKTINAYEPNILTNLLTTKLVFPDSETNARIGTAISTNKVAGNGLSARIVMIAASAIAPSFTKLMNTCITSGVFPSVWKLRRIKPLYKVTRQIKTITYRPISIPPIMLTVLEGHL